MSITLLVHILGGSLGIITGFVALYAAKGAKLHRQSGMVFVYSMVTMALVGAGMGAYQAEAINVVAGLLTAYLVFTALTTVRPATVGLRRLEIGAMLMVLALGLSSCLVGVAALAGVMGNRGGVPAFMFFIFGIAALLAGVSDWRMLRSGGAQGAARLVRHLRRMCFALFIAAASFFLGQADVIPTPLRIPGLLALPVLTPLLAILYWQWRLRGKQTHRLLSTE